MAKIPVQVAEVPLATLLIEAGFKRFKDPGKVSEMFIVPGYQDVLLILTTKRKSIFDFVLNCQVEKTDEVITAMTVLIYTKVLMGIKTHLLAYGQGIDDFLPKNLRNNSELQKRVLVVKEVKIAPIECISRERFAGSIVDSVRNTGQAYGYVINPNTRIWGKLPFTIFTPTSKAQNGHDKPLSPVEVDKEYGLIYRNRSNTVIEQICSYCEPRRLVAADGKSEFSVIIDDDIVLADKLGPDEIRFVSREEYEAAMRAKRAPASLDKQILRNWGKKVKTPFLIADGADKKIIGIDNLDPDNPEHVAFVHSLKVPKYAIEATRRGYLKIIRRLNDGKSLDDFQREVMGINT